MKNSPTPIKLFEKWFSEEEKLSKLSVPTAVCLSTIGLDGFPNSRFVSLKEVIEESFIITTSFDSRKGAEIEVNNKVALTFWWTETQRQVRIQGIATKIDKELAQKYFYERDLDSQIVSLICQQGKETDDIKALEKEVLEMSLTNPKIEIPKNWGGYSIKPIRIEFMEFRKTRFHDRKLYEMRNNEWTLKQLQP
ncbi:pyridoxal 5'-phosphate synthase (plasmid) [Bernardetia sp. Wsw4-3y2]|uniref:pyridoxine/pyridoxamine 5'-phosphate oxidase n=1 Tax=Bernardetia sp. Wsw4-3y2 TaxID=3127471 RepID=UPI0030CDDB1E